MNVLEDLKDQLKHEEKHVDYLITRMKDDLEMKDFEHICRIAAEANESKGKIEILKGTMRMIERASQI